MPFWDFFEDELLIVGAFCHHYQMRVSDFYEMDYYEFYMLLPEVMGSETAFARTIRLRRETDRDRIKNFDADQKAEWNRWQEKAREWNLNEEKRIQAWREENKELIEQRNKEFEEKKKIAAERLKQMLNS